MFVFITGCETFEVAGRTRQIREKNESPRPSRLNEFPPGEESHSRVILPRPLSICLVCSADMSCGPFLVTPTPDRGLCLCPDPCIRASLAPGHEDQPLLKAVDYAECFPTGRLVCSPCLGEVAVTWKLSHVTRRAHILQSCPPPQTSLLP